MIVISDTSPVCYLVLIEAVEVLPVLFGRVIVPSAVVAELLHERSPIAVRRWSANPPTWLEVRHAKQIDRTINLGSGETEAISLAQELHADRLLLDDLKARAVAVQRGVAIAGTLTVLALAAERGLVDMSAKLDALEKTNFRAPADYVAELRRRYDRPGVNGSRGCGGAGC